MARTAAIVAAGLALLALALWRRADGSRPSSGRLPEPVSTPAKPVPPAGADALPPALAGTPCPAEALLDRVTSLSSRLHSRVRRHREEGTPYDPEELAQVMAMERELQGLLGDLTRALRENPAEGHAVLNGLVAMEDEEAALRIAASIGPAFDDSVRARLVRALEGAGSLRERLIACRALAADRAPATLHALLRAARRDPEPGGRLEALEALEIRRARGSLEDVALIEHAATILAAGDADGAVRARAAHVAAPPAPGHAGPKAAAGRGAR
jgi:hypothetical protein